ncbi:hypothetical protein [Streptomyces sp. S.PB5]|uniref:hypothetical protein n=1 Tax=Streptomyces sp. S.PB5 TaxID=3020844 RepID=UPI0025B00E66|nr:hypothetical protein [Streptomyces sp. S.PB5]MDN3025879.1 hypothetical protein [Streptomyces sp. S.PB5]
MVPQIAAVEQMLVQVVNESAEAGIVRTDQNAQVACEDQLALGVREGDVGPA